MNSGSHMVRVSCLLIATKMADIAAMLQSKFESNSSISRHHCGLKTSQHLQFTRLTKYWNDSQTPSTEACCTYHVTVYTGNKTATFMGQDIYKSQRHSLAYICFRKPYWKFNAKINARTHDDVIQWTHSPRHCPFVRGIHRSPVTGEFPSQRPGTRSFDVFFKRLSKHSRRRSFDTPWRSLWHHCNTLTSPWAPLNPHRRAILLIEA